MGQRNAQFLWQSNANAYRRDYRAMDGFDLDVVSVSTGPALIAAKHLRMNVDLQADYMRLGNARLAMFKSIVPSVTWGSRLARSRA